MKTSTKIITIGLFILGTSSAAYAGPDNKIELKGRSLSSNQTHSHYDFALRGSKYQIVAAQIRRLRSGNYVKDKSTMALSEYRPYQRMTSRYK